MVMIQEATQRGIATDLSRRRRIHRIIKPNGNHITNTLARTPLVMMDLDQLENMAQMPFTQENQVVERLANFPDVPFSKGVAERATKRSFNDLDSIAEDAEKALRTCG